MTHCNCIDVHTHVVPEDFPRYAGSGTNVPWPSMEPAHACHRHVVISGKNYRTVSDGAWSAPRRLEAMQQMGVDLQVLSPMPELMSYWLPLEDAKVLVRYINEEIARLAATAPDRFRALGGVPLQDTSAAIAELEFVVQRLGFAGVEIASHVNGTSIGDPGFEPFFARAAQLGAAVFVHALRPAGKDRLVGNAFAEQVVCFPGDIALAAASMITGGIAARNPSLRIGFSHGGGAMAMLLPRLVQAWHVVPKARESLEESPEVYARRFFYDTAVFSPAALRFLVDTMGSSQVFVGSDYPFGMTDKDPVASIRAAGFDAATAAALLAGNAQRFLNLETSP